MHEMGRAPIERKDALISQGVGMFDFNTVHFHFRYFYHFAGEGGAVYTASETEWSSGAILKDQPNVVLHQVDIWSPRPSSQLNFESSRWRPCNRTYMCCMCLECENNAAREMATELWRHRSALQLWTKGRRGWKASLAVFALQQQHHRSLGMFCSR